MGSELGWMDAIPEITWTARCNGHIDCLNRKWYEYTGLRHLADASSEALEAQWWESVHPDDRESGRQALRKEVKGSVPFMLDVRLRRSDGIAEWFCAHVSPLRRVKRSAAAWLGICTDIENYKRQGQRFAFIAKAGEVLAESLDLQTTLERLLAIIVPEFGDWAAIDLFDENDRLKTEAVIHADVRKMRLVKKLLDRYNHAQDAEPTIAAILRKGQPLILRNVSDELVAKAAAPELLGVIRALAPRSAVTVPLRRRGRTLGSLVAYWAETPRQYEPNDMPLFEELTRRAAVAIENARLYERQREVAAEFQRAALPTALPQIAGIRFDSIYVPASDRELLGGDWYDALRLNDGRVVISIGDVAGSGLAAAVIMSSMRQVLRGVAQVYPDPIAMLYAADRTLRIEHPDIFVTAFVGVFDPVVRILKYASAGHPPPLVRDSTGSVTELAPGGLPLGLRVRGETSASVMLPESALLVFYTDGLVEAEHDIVGAQERLSQAVSRSDIANCSNPADALYRAMLNTRNNDDVVVLTLRLDVPIEKSMGTALGNRAARWVFGTSDARAAHNARQTFVRTLSVRGLHAEDLDAAEAIFGELLGNVVRHAPGPIEIMLDCSEATPVLHVLDRGPGFTIVPLLPSDLLSERGRGLYIVWSLADDFNVTERFDGGSHARAVLGRT